MMIFDCGILFRPPCIYTARKFSLAPYPMMLTQKGDRAVMLKLSDHHFSCAGQFHGTWTERYHRV